MATSEREEREAEARQVVDRLLGELDPGAEPALQERLSADLALKALDAEMSDTLALLREGLDGLPQPERSEAQQAALQAAIEGDGAPVPAPPTWWARWEAALREHRRRLQVAIGLLGGVAAGAMALLVWLSEPPQVANLAPTMLEEATAAEPAEVPEAEHGLGAAPEPRYAPPEPQDAPSAAPARRPQHPQLRRERRSELDDLLNGAVGSSGSRPPRRPAPSASPRPAPRQRPRASEELFANPYAHDGSGASRPARSPAPATAAHPTMPTQEAAPSSYGSARSLLPTRHYGFVDTRHQPVSSFAADTDTASYARLRDRLSDGLLPDPGTLRVEELINYFDYDYVPPAGPHPVAVHTEVASAPWNPRHRLLRIGIKARAAAEIGPRNLVLVVDTSGSMRSDDRLPLLKQSLLQLVDGLRSRDRVAVVAYAEQATVVLPPTSGSERRVIRDAISRLSADGMTNGSDALQLAYQLAEQGLMPGANNRVLLATDGAFNAGETSLSALRALITRLAGSGVYLSVLGFGHEAGGDATLEELADRGNGNYAFIDSPHEAHRVLVRETSDRLVTVARDVKFQVAFDPERVASYRRVGYENRAMANADFADDRKDGGELGAGEDVTVFYELELREGPAPGATGAHVGSVRVRYTHPGGTTGRQLDVSAIDRGGAWEEASRDFRFAAAVAELGLLQRRSTGIPLASHGRVIEMAAGALGPDRDGYRAQFVDLVRLSRGLLR